MGEQITPGERRELRSVVRHQMKVLRAEVAQREAELLSEMETRLVERYQADDERADQLAREIAKLRDNANRELQELVDQYEDLFAGGRWRAGQEAFGTPRLYRSQEDRKQLRAALVAGIAQQVKSAQLALDRQEADLLRELALDALETSAARAFLGRIPTVAELVPSRRLREIETEFDAEDGQR